MHRSVPALSTFVVFALASSLLPAQLPDTSASAERQDVREVSQVRIIRLSQVAEKVELDRNTGRGFEPTILNLPVVQGNRLRTGRGLAEVEFEDNSTLRITPDTEVDFPTLGRTATGDTLNTLKLTRGTLYVSLVKGSGAGFILDVADKTISIPPGTHIRVDVYPAGSEIYVFEGRVFVTDGSGSQLVQKAHALKFGEPGKPEPKIARDDTPGLYDTWDQTAVKYHGFAAGNTSLYAYGTHDLSTYGQFADVGGCGQMWTPYFSNASFDPFANGAWAWYPTSGYTFVSAYPWGWLPYHSGSWANCGGRWGWQPAGGNWHGLNNHPITRPVKGPIGFRPILPPAGKEPVGKSSFVLTGTVHATPAHVVGSNFVFSKDSAGLGVPRETFSHLGKISAQLDQKGFAQRPVEATPILAAPVTSAARASSGAHTAPLAAGPVRTGLVAAPVSLQSRPVASPVGGYGSGSSSNSGSVASWTATGGSSARSTIQSNAPVAAPVSSGGTSAASAPTGGGSHH